MGKGDNKEALLHALEPVSACAWCRLHFVEDPSWIYGESCEGEEAIGFEAKSGR